MPPFTKDEVYELNEWIREKRGTIEEWFRQRKADRREQEEAQQITSDHIGD
jgi:hypothetical protein